MTGWGASTRFGTAGNFFLVGPHAKLRVTIQIDLSASMTHACVDVGPDGVQACSSAVAALHLGARREWDFLDFDTTGELYASPTGGSASL